MKAGIIPIMDGNMYLLISNSKGNYIFPKGGVKKNETNLQAAVREAYEESGIKGQVEEREIIDKVKNIRFFKMKVETQDKDFPESDKRKILICNAQEALSSKKVPEYVKRLINYIENK